MTGLARRRAAVALGTLAAVAFGVAFGACRPAAERSGPEPLATEDIGASVDASVTTEYDVQARSSVEIVGPSLPDGFPSDIPLCGSLVNHGPAAEGRQFVTVSVPAAPDAARPRCDRQIESSGWRRVGEGEFERGGRRISVSYRQGAPGTWVRIVYQATR
jgi:hypothetical protein